MASKNPIQLPDWAQNVLYGDNQLANALKVVENNVKIKREYTVYGLTGLLLLCVFCNWNGFIVNLVGFIYPAYASVLAIESECKKDDTKWLMYWVCYALFGILEFFSDILLYWLPFYFFFKLILLVWLMVPGEYGGTQMVYFKFIRIFVIQNQDLIESSINDAKDKVNRVIKEQVISNVNKRDKNNNEN